MIKELKGVCIQANSSSFTAQRGKDKGKEITKWYYAFILPDESILEVSSAKDEGYSEKQTDVYSDLLADVLTLERYIFNGEQKWRFAK